MFVWKELLLILIFFDTIRVAAKWIKNIDYWTTWLRHFTDNHRLLSKLGWPWQNWFYILIEQKAQHYRQYRSHETRWHVWLFTLRQCLSANNYTKRIFQELKKILQYEKQCLRFYALSEQFSVYVQNTKDIITPCQRCDCKS